MDEECRRNNMHNGATKTATIKNIRKHYSQRSMNKGPIIMSALAHTWTKQWIRVWRAWSHIEKENIRKEWWEGKWFTRMEKMRGKHDCFTEHWAEHLKKMNYLEHGKLRAETWNDKKNGINEVQRKNMYSYDRQLKG